MKLAILGRNLRRNAIVKFRNLELIVEEIKMAHHFLTEIVNIQNKIKSNLIKYTKFAQLLTIITEKYRRYPKQN